MENPKNQRVNYCGAEYNVIKEGLAYILNPPAQEAAATGTKKDLKSNDESQSVFYNPIQQFNRDLSVLAIRAFGERTVDQRKQRLAKRNQKRGTDNSAEQGTKRKREGEDNTQEPVAKRLGIKEDEEANSDSPEIVTSASGEQTQNGKQQPVALPGHSFKVLDALSATGLRALRYASELPMVTKVVANDLSTSAIDSMKTNIGYNKLEGRIQPNLGDARAFMYGCGPAQKFDVIDLDPYGTAAPFTDAAVQAVRDGGLLCVTCTDAGVWASTGYAEKAYALYGGVPIKGPQSHEGGLRLILNSIAISAARYGMSIEPLLSYRLISMLVKFLASNTMVVYNCDSGCGAWTTQPLAVAKSKLDRKGNPVHHFGLAQAPTAGPHCEHCGFKTHLAGPMWGGKLHNTHFIQKILGILPDLDPETYQTIPRIEGMLTTALEEDLDAITSEAAEANPQDSEYPAIIPRSDPTARDPYPFFMTLSNLSRILRCTTVPADKFRGALHSIGYRSTRSHARANSIRTDAPWTVVWEVMREWVRQHSPIKESSLKPGTAAAAIMSKSRENLRKVHDGDSRLALLKKNLLAAVESGRDADELITKIEASLYRSSPRSAVPFSEANKSEGQPNDTAPQEHPESNAPEKAHYSTLDIRFDSALGREASAAQSKKRLVRYQMNPRANWGPLNRATVTSNQAE
ncbi:hypothetical protein N7470_006718 [Penicillium chermesinum]|nr:hypothetical protein N7470_006718 [Penicillium chermesinum]